ncbi:carbohydrate sulfotransferase 11-like [Pecten maximus]|uniref:carbohydrate sulfotransferase 11-like n=1 Tax=Pecten maximus TaxID=6579 RepID=UPI001458A1EB|nr:carbohydrate sulfotransferase 11-like [Pecten maximus]
MRIKQDVQDVIEYCKKTNLFVVGTKLRKRNPVNALYADVKPEKTNSSHLYRDRNTFLYDNCETSSDEIVKGRRPIYFFAKTYNLAFCKAPKAGSTFVGTVVAALELSGELGNLFHINREIVHGLNEVTFPTISRFNDVKTVLVARNPYSRLFSAYIDKYFVLGARSKMIAIKKGKGRLKMGDGYCGYDISFQEFLDYFTDRYIAGDVVEEHTVPVSSLCYPCIIHYDVLCKQETLTSDMEHILDVINISTSKRKAIMSMIHSKTINDTIYAFISSHMLYFYLYPDDCLNEWLLMEKLWKVLQFQGYISLALAFPANDFQKMTEFHAENVTDLILQKINSYPLSKSQRSTQRERVLAHAYSSIKSSTLIRVQRMFAQDFHLFGYDTAVPNDGNGRIEQDTLDRTSV